MLENGAKHKESLLAKKKYFYMHYNLCMFIYIVNT